MSTEKIDLSKLSTAELEQVVKDRKNQESKALEKEKADYEKSRDTAVSGIIEEACTLHELLSQFKEKCHTVMDNQAKKLAEYGKLRSNSKGGFSITDAENSMKITRRRDTEPVWDERSKKAEELIKDFLGDTIKKRDAKMYEILMEFLGKNEKGELEYSRVMDLFKHESKFDDPRWKEGLRLIKESFSNHLKGYGYELKFKEEVTGKWETITLNFSSL